jgi:hypothetical protein
MGDYAVIVFVVFFSLTCEAKKINDTAKKFTSDVEKGMAVVIELN